jgi:hypothetical protein
MMALCATTRQNLFNFKKLYRADMGFAEVMGTAHLPLAHKRQQPTEGYGLDNGQ